MKILFIVPYVPNLVRVRPYNMIRSLAGRGHQVTVLTLWTSDADQSDLEHLREFCEAVYANHMPAWRSLWNCAQVLPTRDPLQSVYSWQPGLIEPFLNDTSYDVVHVEHLRGARYGLHFKKQSKIPVVWDSVDCITHLFRQASAQSTDRLRRWRSRLDLKRTERYEGWLVNQFDRVLVTSPTDKQMLALLSEKGVLAPIEVVPNGVALQYFHPDTAVTREAATLIISGKMSYHANITMATHMVNNIMPHVWQHRPDARLQIVGKDPTRDILALGQHANVAVTGTVPELPPYLQKATLAVAPITYNAGIQNKVLEAMACATPVVTTPQATASLQLTPGQDVLVAEQPAEFAQQIVSLLNNPHQQFQVGQAGRAYVETYHNWTTVAQKLEGIYREVIHEVKATTGPGDYPFLS